MSTTTSPAMPSSSVSLSDSESAAISGPISEVSSDTANSTVLTSVDIDGHDPELFLKFFNLLRKDSMGDFYKELAALPTKLPDGYKNFSKLVPGQHIKLKSFVTLQLSNELKQKVYATMPAAGVIGQDGQHEPPITKHDKSRLGQLRGFSGAVRIWIRAFSPQAREVIDSAESNEEINLSAFNELASIFNNRSKDDSNPFQPQNPVCEYDEGGKKKMPEVNANPALFSNATFETLKDIDPAQEQAPIRDGKWIKKQMGFLRTEFYKVHSLYVLSGSQKGDNTTMDGIDEFVLNFARTSTAGVQYCVTIWDSIMCTTVSKDLGEDGEESGVLDATDESLLGTGSNSKTIQPKSIKRKEQRKRKSDTQSESNDDNSVTSNLSDDGEDAIASGLQSIASSMQRDTNIRSWEAAMRLYEDRMQLYDPQNGRLPDAQRFEMYLLKSEEMMEKILGACEEKEH